MPCSTFREVGGELNGLPRHVRTECGNRMGSIALIHHAACATLTPATLGGDTEFKLDFIETQPRFGVADNFSVGDATAYTDNHGRQAVWAGC